MVVKEGYKNTEVGVIPEDWEVDKIENVCSITTGSKNTQDRIDGAKYPFFVRSQTIERIDTFSFDGEAVLTAGDGVGTGKIFHYINDKFDFHQRVYKMSHFKENMNGYFFYLYFSNHFYDRIMQMTAKSSVDSVRREMIANMKILIPTLPEQTAIATVLSDTDNLIQALEKKIAKKELIKKGAMQELLEPKEEWEVKRLTDIVYYIHGKAHEKHIVEYGKYIVVNSKFISTEGKVAKTSNYNFCQANKGDVLTVLSDLPNGKALAKCYYVQQDEKYAINQRICIWRSKKSHPLFLFYLLNRNKYFLKFDDGVSQTHILNHHIEKFELSIPIAYEEQVRIATILSDMNNEIESLQEKLSKYKQLKQGLMQELLTGRIRLV